MATRANRAVGLASGGWASRTGRRVQGSYLDNSAGAAGAAGAAEVEDFEEVQVLPRGRPEQVVLTVVSRIVPGRVPVERRRTKGEPIPHPPLLPIGGCGGCGLTAGRRMRKVRRLRSEGAEFAGAEFAGDAAVAV